MAKSFGAPPDRDGRTIELQRDRGGGERKPERRKMESVFARIPPDRERDARLPYRENGGGDCGGGEVIVEQQQVHGSECAKTVDVQPGEFRGADTSRSVVAMRNCAAKASPYTPRIALSPSTTCDRAMA